MATISAGTTLGVYEVLGSIGSGGMGTVYRARDTRLPREAAIKVSAARFTDRFAREAHAIASLNHPNITTLYDVGPDYLVMELVEGPTLADRIAQGPLSVDEASGIARQIAEALDYAHERGIVHRDLKPGNVKIRPDGLVKVLDFGLAKAGAAIALSDQSPTMTAHQTEAGVIVGTAAYMAPEQVKGQEVDKRADIWAFGCVLYEMLVGASVYRGGSTQETMASILRDEPDLTKVPARARRLLKRCLEKDPNKRLRHIGDVMALLDEPVSGEYSAPAVAPPAARSRGARWLWPVVAVGVLLLAVAGAVWAPWRSQTSATGQAVRFEVGETDKLKFFYGAAMAVSPDGHWMVFPAVGEDGVARYWLRSLDTVEARPLPGTETAYVPAAWTADSRHVLFATLNSQTLKKVDIQGGPPQTISSIQGAINGATENRDGVVVFASSRARMPIFRVAEDGKAPIPLTALASAETAHRFPQFLPDGRHFLYFRDSTDTNRRGIYAGVLDVKPGEQSQTRILATNREAYYAISPDGGPGRLLFLRDTTLMAQPFDPGRLEVSGSPVPVAEDVASFTGVSYGMFSVSDTGTVVYRGGAGAKFTLMWFDAIGRPGESFDAADYANPAQSPDGTRIAVAVGPPGSRDIVTIDVARRTTTRLTFDPANDDNPVWSPDGRNVAFSSNRGGTAKLYLKPADGSADERLLTDHPGSPTSWSPDGRFLLFTSPSPSTGLDIWALPDPGRPAAESRPYPVLATSSAEQAAQVSPDGRWLAYQSDEQSAADVFVRPFSPEGRVLGGARYLVSNGGLSGLPRWGADGRQLIFMKAGDFQMQAVDVDTSRGFQAGNPRRLFPAPPPLVGVGWSLSPDGKRFLFVTTPNGGRNAPFTVVLNWAAALRK
jgi:eukaryotic-like serine/threonine-protein kinase